MGYDWKKHWEKKRKSQLPKEKMIYEVKGYVCKSTFDYLNNLTKVDGGLPISRYVQIAIDNEMDQEKPFNYPLTWPEGVYLEDQYAHEATLIFTFLRKYSMKGISLMMLLLLRREVGIESREKVYRGYVELLNSGMVEEFYPKHSGFTFPRWYRKIKIKGRVTV